MTENIVFVRPCEKCDDYLGDENFERDTLDICKGCMRSVKNKCQTCGKKGKYNFENYDYGVRCKNHKEKEMVNTMDKIYCKKRFIERIEKLGGKVVGEYKNANIPVDCICKNGHNCKPIPANIQSGQGMCRVCSGKDSETARVNFISKIIDLGGRVVGEYKGSNTPVDCICKNGHNCKPIPSNIQSGQGMCIICTGHDIDTSRINFISRVNELGGRVVGEYINNNTPVDCICKNGHNCKPRPASIQQDVGMCRICSKRDSETSKLNFISRIIELGGRVVGEYKGKDTPVDCICKNGHNCKPRPASIQQGHGMCKICARNDSETARINFINRIIDLGGTVVGEYINNNTPVDCICKNGHNCKPRPAGIQQGGGMCKRCKQSGGEVYISHVLDKMGISYKTEVQNHLIKNRFRYDFYFQYKDKKYYLEFDGEQHFKCCPHWHTSIENFNSKRQVDLYKNYIAKKSGVRMIRICYNQVSVSIDTFCEYFKNLLDNRDADTIVDSELYNDWICDVPSPETIEKYSRDEDVYNDIDNE